MIRERLRERWQVWAQLMRLDKPVGIYLLLWPTLWALWFAAGGLPPLLLLAIFVAGTMLMRSAGCVINDLADRKFDGHVERTRQRPLASGRARPAEALILFVVLGLISLAVAAPLNAAALWLTVPAIVLAASYPFAKRFHSLPQAHLGIAFSWGIPMASAAVSGAVDWPMSTLLMAANLCWVIAYDTLYAMVDRDDDLRIGVKSSAILFGRFDRLIVGLLQTAALLLLAFAGWRVALGWPYYAGLLLAAIFAAHQLWQVRHRERAACFSAFVGNNRIGALVFLGLAVSLPPF
ncbi:4-hydroxybenzoate octaprenyltransferase [Nevskia ramosa]|uniref:4-hydroxybenzoate octaprenyltransferase n=1 Tax=Nevskia ramosa TaxID=64002 RepID=UPI003D11CB2A